MRKLNLNTDSNESYLNELRRNKNLEGIEVNINNCNLLSRYLDDFEHCSKCKGLNECPNEPKGYKSKISQKAGYTNLSKIPCSLMQESLKNQEIQSKFRALFLPSQITEASFDNYRLDSIERQKIYQYMTNFTTSFKRGTLTKGLYICGNFQIGKTYSLACGANLFAKAGINSLLIYFPDLVRELKSLLSKPDEFEDRINMLKSVDVLMLDDIGAELPSAWVRDEILCPILNYRSQEKLPVFFSTNYTLDGLRKFYMSIDSSSNSADRLISRIKTLASFVEIK